MSISQTAQISLASAALLNGGAVPSPVVQNGNATPALASEAAQLSQDSSAIVLLGGGSDVSTYDAAALLNGFAAAGTLQGSLLSPSGGESAQDSTDQQIVSQTLGAAGSAGSSLNGNWATILQSNPALAGEAVADSANGSIVDTIA
ncbi:MULTISPECIES: hypothetical protein [Chromobacteriaceae]|uniref:Uncharacterized protein n=1 Tax=Pseudogulbenkiania ferrooxidans EGD-HP2 TaxID=1388764 RepID=A0ABN0N9J9_9NEIS|nr:MULTISPECIES: hypothetical protein [Chromobacteriaceae]AVG14585.1 hypothetical protein CFN79_01135 [Chromobacterium vaccinii]ERE14946.1 hypothetical protein O166_23235 [Pseudogulbenkiania ferrooxidans EGD-HP2]